MKKIKVAIPSNYMKSSIRSTQFYSGAGYKPGPIIEKRYVAPEFTKLLKEYKISFDTNRGLMFFNTEEEAALFKLSHL